MSRRRACDVCYRKKIQCSIPDQQARCDWCAEHDLLCTFTRAVQKKKPRLNLSDFEGLFSRVEQLENALARGSPIKIPSRVDGQEIGDLVSSSSDDDDEPLQSELTPSSGIFLPSQRGRRYIYSKTGRDVSFQGLRAEQPWSSLLGLAGMRVSFDEELWILPPRQEVLRLSSAYFESHFQLIFPVLDKVLFDETIELAYEQVDSSPSSSQIVCRTCVLAAFSMLCRLEGSKEVIHSADADKCAVKAQYLLAHVPGETTLIGLQTILILQHNHGASLQGDNVTPLHAVACRMVCALGGHVYQALDPYQPDISLAIREAYHLRALFWICYIADKDISLRSGQPPLLTEEYCDLTVPEHCTIFCARLHELDANFIPNSRHTHVPGDTDLCRIKERTYHLLYSPQALKLSDMNIVSLIRQLDDDLERWRSSIPLPIQPRLSLSPDEAVLSVGSHSLLQIEYTHLQLEYYYILIAIHSSIRRCGSQHPDSVALPEYLHRVIHSSCDIYLEASHSSLVLLSDSIRMIAGNHLSRITSNLNAAVVTLFIDIIAHPHGEQVQNAIESLISALGIVQTLVNAGMTRNELTLAQETSKLISCLIWGDQRTGNIADANERHSFFTRELKEIKSSKHNRPGYVKMCEL
ncbi:hypothetical protein F5Y16DRAFT_414573 [Xylariaceae sp. FL0255]|nr:hypothetical protein F5Y16DRAFT_414573 [Xylariaceae sp. FL0255]